MGKLEFYIAYLLTKHECVIITGLGAFVSSSAPENKLPAAEVFSTPGRILGFNSEITHNDGLVANALAKGEDISYNEACLLIKQFTDKANLLLKNQQEIKLPWVGSLFLSPENKILFKPATFLSCNANYYGFSNFYLSTLDEIYESLPQESPEEKALEATIQRPQRSLFNSVATAAAAAIALFVITTPLNKGTIDRQTQSAAILNLPVSLIIPSEETTETEEIYNLASDLLTEETVQAPVVVEEKAVPKRHYHIVIASLPTKNAAEERLERFQKEEFPEAALISNEEKHRIYVKKFEDKTVAEEYLETFRTAHPKHAKAWLLTQRS